MPQPCRELMRGCFVLQQFFKFYSFIVAANISQPKINQFKKRMRWP